MKLEKKTIVITGGNSGIGYELVKQLTASNDVLVIARQKASLARLKEQFRSIVTYQADLSRTSEVEVVADTIVKKYENIDVLINNAAIQYTPAFLDNDFRYETIQQEITTNFTSVCGLSHLLLPSLLKETRSLILNINSGLGLSPKSTSAVYCATKGALNIFSQSLAYQLEKTNIKVLQAFLPLVETPMTEGRGRGKLPAQKVALKILKGLSKEIKENDVGKVKLLRILLRLWPGLAQNIMKKG